MPRIAITPAIQEQKRQRMSPTITVEIDPFEDPALWLQCQIETALMELLSDPRPLIYDGDGKFHYGTAPTHPKPMPARALR